MKRQRSYATGIKRPQKKARTTTTTIIRSGGRSGYRSSGYRNARTGGFLGLENKFLDSELTSTALSVAWTVLNPTATGCVDSLSVPAQGDGFENRDGRKYQINSIHIRGRYARANIEAQPGPIGNARVRCVVYLDKQTNAAEAAGTDIMDAGGNDDLFAFRNLQNSTRFDILYDKEYTLRPQNVNEGAANSFTGVGYNQSFKFNKTFAKPIVVNCVGTTANVTSVSDNNIGIAFISDDTNVTVSYQCRVRFSG